MYPIYIITFPQLQHRNCLAADPKLAADNPHSAVELLALSARTLLDRASDSASRMRIESGDRLKLMQFNIVVNIIIINVFEDELTDAPGATRGLKSK